MIRVLTNLVTKTAGELQKSNRNYKAYICSSFSLESTFEEIDFCGWYLVKGMKTYQGYKRYLRYVT